MSPFDSRSCNTNNLASNSLIKRASLVDAVRYSVVVNGEGEWC
jgi:hypothetical protein